MVEHGEMRMVLVLLLGRLRLIFLVRLAITTTGPALIDRHGSTFRSAANSDFPFSLASRFAGTGEPRQAPRRRRLDAERGAFQFGRHRRRRR